MRNYIFSEGMVCLVREWVDEPRESPPFVLIKLLFTIFGLEKA